MDLNTQNISSKMTIPPQLKGAYQRIVLAGQKFLYDPSTRDIIKQQLAGPGPIDQKLGQGISDMMIMLFNKSNHTMPPQLIIPAGVELLIDAAEFLNKAAPNTVPKEAIGSATEAMIFTLLQKFGIPKDKAMQMMHNFHQNAQKMNAGAPGAQTASGA